jgi:hypothetical protein
MRKMIAIAAVLAMSTANAEELKFGDVNYFLKQGEINVLVDAVAAYQKETIQDEAILTRGYIFETQTSYAFSNELNAFVGLDYAYKLEDKTTGNGDIQRGGLANPALGVNYRFMNQNQATMNVDFGAVARINVQDAESGDADGQNVKDGNFADGRNSLELNARMGNKWNEANEWQLAGGVVYFNEGDSTLRQTTGNEELTEESSMDLFLRGSYQYRPVNEFMVLLTAQATRVGAADSEVKSSGGKIESDAHLDLDFGFVAKYLITDGVIARFNYGQSRNADYDIKVLGDDSEVRKRRENFYGFGIDLLF